MVLSREEIDDLRAECFANDVEYDYDRLKDCDEARVRAFFESGGDHTMGDGSEPPFLAALRTANAEIVAQLKDMQPTQGDLIHSDGRSPARAAAMLAAHVEGLSSAWHVLASSYRTTHCRRFLLQALVHSIGAVTRTDADLLGQHFRILSSIALSSEPAVSIELGSLWEDVIQTDASLQSSSRLQPHAGACGVLLLGFGGSSLASLATYEQLYARRYPTWLRIVHAGPLLLQGGASSVGGAEQPETAAALSRCLAAVMLCESLLVHVQSNQGHMIWSHMLMRHGELLRPRLRGVLYDCSAAQQSFFTPAMGADIQTKTVRATLNAFDVSVPPGTNAAIRAGAIANGDAAMASAAQRDEMYSMLAAPDKVFEFQRTHEPAVPAVCITSEADSVIKVDGVCAFAARLVEAQPARSVRVEVLKGDHIMQIHLEPQRYEKAVSSLVRDAGMV